MQQPYSGLELGLVKLVGILARSYQIPADIAAKTITHFRYVIERIMRELYRDAITGYVFESEMLDLIEGQLRRAWYEGMRENGLKPSDMEPEWEAELQDIILSEIMHVQEFASAIQQAAINDRLAGTPEASFGALNARAGLWVNRYNDVRNRAIVATKEQKLEWIYGDTEHCETCARLNGIIAWASEWDLAGVHPQQPPNPVLECGGWRCKCRLQPTVKRKTPKAFDRIMRALGK